MRGWGWGWGRGWCEARGTRIVLYVVDSSEMCLEWYSFDIYEFRTWLGGRHVSERGGCVSLALGFVCTGSQVGMFRKDHDAYLEAGVLTLDIGSNIQSLVSACRDG